MSGASAVAMLLQLATSIILARYLTPAEMGVFAIAFAAASIVLLFQQLNLSALIVRSPTDNARLSNTAVTANAIITFALSGVILLLGLAGEQLFSNQGVSHVLFLLSVSPLFGIFSFLPGAHLERDARFRDIALISACASIVGSVATVGLALSGFSYMSFALSQIASSAISSALTVALCRDHLRFSFGLSEFGKVAKFGFQIFTITGISNLTYRASEVLLGKSLGLSNLGLYNRASSIHSIMLLNVRLAAARVVFVNFTHTMRNNDDISVQYLAGVSTVTAIFWPIFVALAILADPLIDVIYGPKWAGAVPTFQFLSFASLGYVATTFTPELFVATGHVSSQARADIWRSIFSLASFSIACMISLEAAAATRFIDAMIMNVLYFPLIKRAAGVRYRAMLQVYLRSIQLTVLAVAPISVTVFMVVDWRAHIILIILAIATGITLWFFGLRRLQHELWVSLLVRLRLAVRER